MRNILKFAIDVKMFAPEGQLVMVTEGRVQVVNQGSSVVFQCEFVEEKYNFFQQPVIIEMISWKYSTFNVNIQLIVI